MPSFQTECQDSGFSTSSSLVPELQAESPQRWESFVLAYSPLLRFWIRHEGIPTDFIDDILQETLKSAFGAIGKFRRKETSGSFRGWLRTIVRRRCADHFRRQTGERQGDSQMLAGAPVPEQKDPADIEAEENAVEALRARVMELVRRETSEKAWQMFWQSAVDGFPASEIAARFGVSAAAVRVAKARVLHKLRQLMPDPE